MRYFRWNTQRINSEWFNNTEGIRVAAGLDFDVNLRKKYPEIDSALKGKNDNTCPVFYCEFDENDPQMKPVSLSCGHQFSYASWEHYLREKVTDRGM